MAGSNQQEQYGDRPGDGTPSNSDSPLAVVTGSLTRDRIRSRFHVSWRIGGVVWYAGTTLARLGLNTRVVTRAAPEDCDLAETLQSRGVDVWLRASRKTTVFVNDYTAKHQDDRTQEVEALADPIEGAELSRALVDADLLYLGPLHPGDFSDDALSLLCAERSYLVALDIQGFTRVVRGHQVFPGSDPRLPRLLRACDFIKASESEARLITNTAEASDAVCNLALTHPGTEVVVTCGANGAYVAKEDVIHYELAVPTQIEDTTGAGDIFFAAYLARRIKGISLDAAAKFAASITAEQLTEPKRTLTLPE